MLLATTGLVTAVPLICFGGAAIRIPMTTLGLLQYLAPTLQFALGLLVFHESMSRSSGWASRWCGSPSRSSPVRRCAVASSSRVSAEAAAV